MKFNKLLILMIAMLIVGCISVIGCVVPYEDMVITEDTTFCEGTYYLNDTEGDGVLIGGASNIIINCYNSIFIGNNIITHFITKEKIHICLSSRIDKI